VPPGGGTCGRTWGGFETVVVRGWPVDLIRIVDETVVYEPLGIRAKRLPLKIGRKGGWGGLRAGGGQVLFDMGW
jgi:hypothetical protein